MADTKDPAKTARLIRTKTHVARSAKSIALRERQEKAVRLRLAGLTLTEIAKQLGYNSPSAVSQAIKAATDRVGVEPARQLVEMELQRLDVMHQQCWVKLIAGDTGEVDRILRIMERRARLTGMDAALDSGKIELHVHGAEVTVKQGTGVMVIEGASEDDYVNNLAAAMGMTPEQVRALRPADHEDPKVIEAASDDIVIEDAEIVEDTSEQG